MAAITNRHQPSFVLFPVNNNRTAWRPFGLPVIMVVPHKRDSTGGPLASSGAFNVRIFIEDVPQESLVAGHDHIGQRFPDKELRAETVDSLELADRAIDISDYQFSRNGSTVEFEDAQDGDLITYTTSTGITDTIVYYQDADYYDLSDILIDVETLPSDDYVLVYQTEYFARIVSEDESQEFLCIDTNTIARANLKFNIQHPGNVLDEFYSLTPPPYLTNAEKSLDTTVALYRPFTDLLQDVADEQDLLERINWVFDVPAEAIPYLSSLLGWELPYFPESLDKLRRAVLRRTVEFQNLKGSRRAIINIFRLFGFEILISNLWWSSDGKRFIRPGERLPSPYENQEIEVVDTCQVDLALNNWNEGGFGDFDIPLLFRPQESTGLDDFEGVRDSGDVTIESYLVAKDSEAHVALQSIAQDIMDNPEGYGNDNGCDIDENGFIHSLAITTALDGKELIGFSQILLSGKLADPVNETLVGPEIPLRKESVSFNREENNLHLTLNGHLDMDGKALYTFAIYHRQRLVVPSVIEDLQSNRFDIQVLTNNLTELADPTTLEFAIEFLFRLKAFHSLLNVIITRIDLTETYEVTNWCVGGDNAQRFDTDAGQLQVPPAIIPDVPGDISDCSKLDPRSLGYKDNDILLRLRKLDVLPDEHEAWKLLDDRTSETAPGLRISPLQPAPDRTICRYTHYGQDRIVGERIESRDVEIGPSPNASQQLVGIAGNPRLSPNDDSDGGAYDTTGAKVTSNSDSGAYGSFTREYTEIFTPLCDIDGVTDYCYKGRVDDELLYRPTIPLSEYPRCKPCNVGMGVGVYYTYPAYSTVIVPGVASPCPTSKTSIQQFSGGATTGGVRNLTDSKLGGYLSVSYDLPLPPSKNSYLGRLYRAYNNPEDETIHYHNKKGLPTSTKQHQNLAIQRPNLVIEKPTLHLPGCRFPRLNLLESDFTHPVWDARPWDEAYSTHCGPDYICGDNIPSFLNASLTVDSNDNEQLVFDEVQFKILGNRLTPDISSLGDHSLGTGATFVENDVVHSVYMESAESSPYVELDQVCAYDTSVGDDGVMVITDPLFTSYNECGTSELIDFADGYKCISGFQDYDGEDFSDYEDVLSGLGMPVSSGTGLTVLVLLSSGILSGDGLRLDCGCTLAGCSGTEEEASICSTDLFVDDDGYHDWECDHLTLELRLKEVEEIGVCSTILNGTIPTLLETM